MASIPVYVAVFDTTISNYVQLLQMLNTCSVLYLSERCAVRCIDTMLPKYDCKSNACSVSGGETIVWGAIDTHPFCRRQRDG